MTGAGSEPCKISFIKIYERKRIPAACVREARYKGT